MQPQESGSLDYWWHALTGAGGAGIGTVLTWIWRAARVEPKLQLEIKSAEERLEAKIQETERRVETKIEEAKRHGEQKVEDEVGHFHEAFNGIRRQIDDLAKGMLPRSEFDAARKEILGNTETARKENREDFNKIRERLDSLIGGRHK